jgi:hypothetical protein
VAPEHTLDWVESIVTHRQVHIRGMVLTLKLSSWELADRIPDYVGQIRSWGYRYVNVRQLAFNRQEVSIAAIDTRRHLRPSRAHRRRQ